MLSVCISKVWAQEKDLQLWADVSVDMQLHKAWKVSAAIGSRYQENIAILQQKYGEVSAYYSWRKHWRMGMQYRYVMRAYPTSYHLHRYAIDISYKYKWRRWRATWRERVQYKMRADNRKHSTVLRSKWKLAYNIKHCKLSPFVAAEHYLALQGKNKGLTDKWRWQCGASYPVYKHTELSAKWMWQQEYNTNNPLAASVFMLSLNITPDWFPSTSVD